MSNIARSLSWFSNPLSLHGVVGLNAPMVNGSVRGPKGPWAYVAVACDLADTLVLAAL